MAVKDWKRFEKMVARRLGGRLQPGSGRFLGAKEDIVTPVCLVQCKSTKRDSLRIHLRDLENLAGQARWMNLIPAMVCLRYAESVHVGYCAIVPALFLEDETPGVSIELDGRERASFLLPFEEAEVAPVGLSIERSHEEWENAVILNHELFEEQHEKLVRRRSE